MSVKLIIPVMELKDNIMITQYEHVSATRRRFACDPFIPGQHQVEVYVNGQYQYPGLDFIEYSGNEIELTEPCMEGDFVLIKVRR